MSGRSVWMNNCCPLASVSVATLLLIAGLVTRLRLKRLNKPLLIEVARRLKGKLRESDILARLGGDEFAIIQAPLVRAGDAELLARRGAYHRMTRTAVNDQQPQA